jgi:transcriptional regulator with XRE-family HTH domain
MIGKDDVRNFLMSRRANVTPGQAGLPQDGGDRRVPGLRREEVAMLAGVSTDYYTRLERGDIGNASRSVLEGIARALQLDDVERDHLFDLARNATSDATGHDDTPRSGSVRESVQRLLDNMQVPAVVYNAHQDLVAANLLGRALFAPIFETRATEPGPLRLPRLPRARLLRGLAAGVQLDRGDASIRSRPRSAERGTHGTDRRAVDPQSAVPQALGRS